MIRIDDKVISLINEVYKLDLKFKQDKLDTELWNEYLTRFNNLRIKLSSQKGKKFKEITRVPDKSKKQFFARIREGYTVNTLIKVAMAGYMDEYHIERNFQHLTIEFLTRPAIVERYDNKEVKIP